MLNKYQNRQQREQDSYITRMRKSLNEKDQVIKELKELVMLSYVEGGMDMKLKKSDWKHCASNQKLRRILE